MPAPSSPTKEQKELRDQIGGYLANFFQAGKGRPEHLPVNHVCESRISDTTGVRAVSLGIKFLPLSHNSWSHAVTVLLIVQTSVGACRGEQGTSFECTPDEFKGGAFGAGWQRRHRHGDQSPGAGLAMSEHPLGGNGCCCSLALDFGARFQSC